MSVQAQHYGASGAVYADQHRPLVAKHLSDGAYKPALVHLLELSRILPPSAELLDDMATCYWKLGDHETAIKLVAFVAKDIGNNPLAWGKLGAMAISVGDTARAKTAFETSLKFNPKDVKTLANLNRLEPFARGGSRTAALRKIAKSRTSIPVDQATAYNTLGHIEDAAGNPKAAFFNWSKAKTLSPGRFDAELVDTHVENQRRVCPVLDDPDTRDVGPTRVGFQHGYRPIPHQIARGSASWPCSS